MDTAYARLAPCEAGRLRHKRKGIPRRSPCRRDMVEAPGVVFRFPDKISAGLGILPSAAGLPPALGSKSAAAVIAAAAAATATAAEAPPAATTVAAAAPTTAPTDAPATLPTAPAAPDLSTAAASVPLPAADLPPISSAASTPALRPQPHAMPIHRSASNVLHYPELLSDLRDRLVMVHHHQAGASAGASSGVESDSSHAQNHHPQLAPRRPRAKRPVRAAESFDSAAATRRAHAARRAGSEAPVPFHRRHSIGTIGQLGAADDDDAGAESESIDIDDSDAAAIQHAPRKPAKRKRDPRDAERRSGSPPAKRSTPGIGPGTGSRRCCASCGVSSTPCWRPGLIDSKTLCNLCGLRYKKGRVYCAGCSYVPTKTEIATGGASVCKRCTLPIHKSAPFVGY
ncbi:DNA-binding transcription repressor [Coemansia javaensis]|uniref:DNA-binding transcription repressor n=1 Tax=Coemansia javaensis TaxID=2761396 RepID=A0A9W8LMS8_9FUNG|nr:DNA-binding transcription repressor [Coemansia javaensis]